MCVGAQGGYVPRPDAAAFRERLRVILAGIDGGQSEAERRTGVRQSKVSGWVAKGRAPNVFDAAQFCRGLGISLEALIWGDGEAHLPGYAAGETAGREAMVARLLAAADEVRRLGPGAPSLAPAPPETADAPRPPRRRKGAG